MSLEHSEVSASSLHISSLSKERYSRHLNFLPQKESSQAVLFNSRVLLAGCGAGSTIARPLAYMGYGTEGRGMVVLADPDQVDSTNLNRQLFNESDQGANKAEALSNVITSLNSDVITSIVREGITPGNVAQLVADTDVVVDMIDVNVPSLMVALHREAKSQGKPVVTGYDLGEGTRSYVFDYRNPGNMTLDRYLGFENFSLEEVDALSQSQEVKLAISIQMLLGPVRDFVGNRSLQHPEAGQAVLYYRPSVQRDNESSLDPIFRSPEEAVEHYTSLLSSEENILLLKRLLPEEMSPVVDDLLCGNIDYIPQIYSAASTLGTIHEKVVRSLLLDQQVKVVPDVIVTDSNLLIAGKKGSELHVT